MSKILIEQLLGSNFIKYDRLSKLVDECIQTNATTVNIYIDLYSVFKPLYGHTLEYDIKDYSILTSCIINMCAHYRAFFKKSCGVDSNIYLVYSKNIPIFNKQLYYGYNSHNESKYMANSLVDEMIQYNIKLLQLLGDYLPSIYTVLGTFETGTIIYDLICRNECVVHLPNFIITRDMYNYQIIPANKDIIILRPKKNNAIDNSYYINNSNLLSVYIKDRESSINITEFANLSPAILSLLMSLTAVKERNIKTIMSLSQANKLIQGGLSKNTLFNGYNSIPSIIWNGLNTDKLKISFSEFELRYKAIDIIYQQSVYMNTPEAKSLKFLDLNDVNTLHQINNQYFTNNPLDLENL